MEYPAIIAPYFRSISIASDAGGDNEYINVAYAARFLGYRPGSATWVMKSLAGMQPDYPNSNQKKCMDAANVSYYTMYAARNVVVGGKTAGGEWIDVIWFRDWLKNDMQLRVLTVLFVNPKVPYTDNGIALIKNQMIASLKQGQAYNGVAPTEYTSDGDEIPGFKTNVPLAADLTPTQKSSRVLTGCTFVARLAGAIHMVNIHGALVYEFTE
jgi:hypothetical protein